MTPSLRRAPTSQEGDVELHIADLDRESRETSVSVPRTETVRRVVSTIQELPQCGIPPYTGEREGEVDAFLEWMTSEDTFDAFLTKMRLESEDPSSIDPQQVHDFLLEECDFHVLTAYLGVNHILKNGRKIQ